MFEKWMMRYLRKRGWVVFYLDEFARKCQKGFCWLSLYETERLKGEVEELSKDLDPALFRVLDRNQHWRDAREIRCGE